MKEEGKRNNISFQFESEFTYTTLHYWIEIEIETHCCIQIENKQSFS